MALLKMSELEICREYRLAKNPALQINILADLNCCSKNDIKDVLIKNGFNVKKSNRLSNAEYQSMTEEEKKARYKKLQKESQARNAPIRKERMQKKREIERYLEGRTMNERRKKKK